jgi:hypothetical protein
MRHLSIRLATLACVAIVAAGCAPLTPNLDSAFGSAARLAVATQTLDKGAAARNAGKDASGLDGTAAKEVMDRYQKSFRAPEPAPSVFTIGVSGSSTSQ